MSVASRSAGMFTCLALAGCVHSPPATSELVRVRTVINAMKCGAALAILKSGERTGIRGAATHVVLNLKVTTTDSIGGGVATEPALVLYQGATLTAGFTASVQQTYTIDSSIEFDIDMHTIDSSICKPRDGDVENVDIGFASWLNSTMYEVDHARAGSPKVRISDYTYDANFAITRKQGASAKLAVVPIAIDASQSHQRDDVQHLKVTIKPIDASTAKAAPKSGGARNEGSGPFAIPKDLGSHFFSITKGLSPDVKIIYDGLPK